jgi:poly(3-hydroxybutyrate) depolymerase
MWSNSASKGLAARSRHQLYELNHAAMAPYRAMADIMRLAYANPLNPLSQTPWGRTMAASLEMFERTTRRYGKPSFGLNADRHR